MTNDTGLDELFTQIARRYLSIKTLRERRLDQLDFHEVSVWGVKSALQAAYDAGLNAARAKKGGA
jgi:hypothetical protein